MAVSIKDIARIAGVSHSTVSRALRGSSLIPASTAERIQQIAREVGYSASSVARSLVSGRTLTIGVVVTSIADPFNGEVVAGLEEVANDRGYSVILATSQALPDRELSVVQSFQSRRVDGIVVASSRIGSHYAQLLAELRIPVVLLNNQHPERFNYSVSIDNATGTCEATGHLLQLGHRRIAYLGDKLGLHSDAERKAGFLQAMSQAGIEVPPEYLLLGDGKSEGAAEAFRVFLEGSFEPPTAVVCYNDMSAVGVLEIARNKGIRLPEELSIVGFDDIQLAAFLSPALTTVRQPKRELGMRSMQLLLKMLAGEPAAKSVVLPGKLIVRDSTAPPA